MVKDKTEKVNKYLKWRIDEDRRLLMLMKENKPKKELALIFNRSTGAISSRIKLLTFSKSSHFKAVRKSIKKLMS